jgi:predicted nuclease with TOPRIM domain
MNLDAVPERNFRFKKDLPKEIKTEVKPKMLGKPEIIKTETENTVFSPKQLKSMEDRINAAVTIKKDYERLQTTDLVQENQKLRSYAIDAVSENKQLKSEIVKLKNQNNELHSDISHLKAHISDLKHEIGSIYKTTKEYFKDRTDDFKRHVRDFVSKVSEKEPQGHFEQLHKRERRREQDRGMER